MKRLSSNCHAAITKLLAGAMTLIAASVHCGAGSDAYGQSANGAATILISQELRVNAGSEAPLDIGVKTSNAAPNQLLLLIRGLPTAISLSRGRLFESGIWALRINDLPKLKITSESTASGNSDLSLTLVGVDGTVLALNRATLVIAPHLAGGAPNDAAIANRDPRQTAAPVVHENPKPPGDLTAALPPVASKPSTQEETEAVQRLMARGDESLKTGKIIVARKFYERAAESGWAPGAFAVGRTYDPQELSKIGVIGGIKPDLDLAKRWYERARDMGLGEATDRLQQIGNAR